MCDEVMFGCCLGRRLILSIYSLEGILLIKTTTLTMPLMYHIYWAHEKILIVGWKFKGFLSGCSLGRGKGTVPRGYQEFRL